MAGYNRESKRRDAAIKFVCKYAPHFGINKQREIIRLVYEISKRDGVSVEAVCRGITSWVYPEVKKRLLRQRFVEAFLNSLPVNKPYLPRLKLNAGFCADVSGRLNFSPGKIFIENRVYDSCLSRNFRAVFPGAAVLRIDSYTGFLAGQGVSYSLGDYNSRKDAVFIIEQRRDFFKACPCTKGAVGCGYHIFNLGFGCVFECSYCYLQEYTRTRGLLFSANIEEFFRRFRAYSREGMRIGSGEFCDSLALDHITRQSPCIIDFFRRRKGVTFEFKTKSDNISNLLKVRAAPNIVVSWSVNPQRIIDENEFFSAGLRRRINSAYQCVQSGYRVGFHFDPLIYSPGWQKAYQQVVDLIFSLINPEDIAWISMGTLRFRPRLKPIIEARFPANHILDREILAGFDDKLRYIYPLRLKMYKKILGLIRGYGQKTPVYLCMEDRNMWRDVFVSR